ncbi:trypsin-like peptidase domain-containing protein [Myxococcota bacterium]|nr:trypsin-like peptidase domain-containing protein [Myxococcota bacterium]MBU1537931.1 trypsin-like peptidase domain-containing protein [Myxococcota bacterium]
MSYPQVVKIYATCQEASYETPWQADAPETASGSGVIVGPGEILTGAHVVAGATFIQVRCMENPDKMVATVKAICHDCDLALLAVDESFTRGIKPATIGDLPSLRDKVSVIGFPIGGDEVSITEGVVSRVEVQQYSHSQRFLVAATVDAAINNGNSGGPVFKGRNIVGIAFQALEEAQNIGEIVPSSLITHFLNGVHQGRETKIPGDGIVWMNLENPFFRKQLKMKKNQSGVYIVDLDWGSSGYDVLKKGDVLTSIDGNPIANNGTILYRNRFRTQFEAFLCDHYVGDSVPVEILRDGKPLTFNIVLTEQIDLVRRSQYDSLPTYYIFGGLVFQPLTRNYLETWSSWYKNAPKDFVSAYFQGVVTEAQRELVVISRVLAHDVNIGYEGCFEETVASVNGVIPRDMKHFVSMVEQAKSHLTITTTEHGVILLDVVACRKAMPIILDRYRIDRIRSTDLDPA